MRLGFRAHSKVAFSLLFCKVLFVAAVFSSDYFFEGICGKSFVGVNAASLIGMRGTRAPSEAP